MTDRPRSPAPPTLAAALAALALGCAASAPAPDDAPETGTGFPVHVTTTTGEDAYPAGTAIEMTLRARNDGTGEVTLNFSNGQRFDFWIETAAGNEVWRWSDGMAFPMVLGRETLAPDEELVWTERVDPGLEPGTYTLIGEVVSRPESFADTTELTIR